MHLSSVPKTSPTAGELSGWDSFVDRYGMSSSIALMLAILALSGAHLRPTPQSAVLAGCQLLLLLITMGCIGVMAYRQHGPPPATVD